MNKKDFQDLHGKWKRIQIEWNKEFHIYKMEFKEMLHK